ncbi:hypothetical protein ABQD82_12025 [Enterococcus gallinarum]|uniref:hypothetical protein n=1 Tax=Enterococcus gallinarum TaxID=1353 RepID=UPI0032E3FC2E
MSKLILKQSKLQALNDSEAVELSNFYFDINQFNVPKAMVTLKEDITIKAEKIRNSVGELVETGLYNLTFKIYDRNFIELVVNNGGTEIGSPITIVVEKYANNNGFIAIDQSNELSLPQLEKFEADEFIPLHFDSLMVVPKKIEKKVFVKQGSPMASTWAYSELKVIAKSFVVGDSIDEKAK